jgi:hypothetical protein
MTVQHGAQHGILQAGRSSYPTSVPSQCIPGISL